MHASSKSAHIGTIKLHLCTPEGTYFFFFVFFLARFIVCDATCRIAGVPPDRRFFEAFDPLFLLTQFCALFGLRAITTSFATLAWFGGTKCPTQRVSRQVVAEGLGENSAREACFRTEGRTRRRR